MLTADHIGNGFTQGSPTLVEHPLEVRQLLFLLIEIEVAGVASCLPLIRNAVPRVGNSIPLVGDVLALVGDSVPLVLKRV